MTMQTVQWRGQLRTGDQAYCRGHIVTLVERVPPDDWKVTGGSLPGVWSAQAHELTPIPGKPYSAHEGRDPRLCYPDGKAVKVGDLVRVTVTGHRAGQTPCEVEKLHDFGQIRLRQGKSTWSVMGTMLEFVGRKSEGELPPVDDGAQPLPDVDADLVPVTEFRTVKQPVMDDTFARSRANHAAKAPMWELKTPPREVSVEEMQAAEAALAEAKAKREAALNPEPTPESDEHVEAAEAAPVVVATEPPAREEEVTVSKKATGLSPKAWFDDHTFLQDKEWADHIFRECMEHHAIAAIDWSEKHGAWVFHTLYDGAMTYRKDIAKEFEPVSDGSRGQEHVMETALVDALVERGWQVQRQVGCAAGIIDVLTDTHLFELKAVQGASAVVQAVGQALCYNATLTHKREPVIVIPRTVGYGAHAVNKLVGEVLKLGVDVIYGTNTESGWAFNRLPEAPKSVEIGLTTGERVLLADCEKVIEHGLKTFIEVGSALADIRDGRLYRESHKTFEAYCEERWGFTRQRAHQIVSAAEVAGNLSTIVDIPKPTNEAQARELVKLTPDEQRTAWQTAVETAPEGRVTAAHVRNVVDAMHAPDVVSAPASDDAARVYVDVQTGEIVTALIDVIDPVTAEVTQVAAVPAAARPLMSSKSAEWYTPGWIMDLVRKVLGEIELDPASTPEANSVVQAQRFLTFDGAPYGITSDTRPWQAKTVYLNPEYGTEIDHWVSKLVRHYEAGDIGEAILLVPARTDTAWFRRLRNYPVCFLKGRVTFWLPGGLTSDPAPFPSAVFYLGKNEARFVKVFGHGHGDVYRRVEA